MQGEQRSTDTRQVIIMGAGPAGLTAGYVLSKAGVGVTVLEADPDKVGGISRTETYRGYRFDIGGHRFFSKSAEIEQLWTELLGDELLDCQRLSRIYYDNKFYDYPLKAMNAFLNLGPNETMRCILSYARARAFPVKNPTNLEDWVTNQFGDRLYRTFFKTYTEKVWGISTRELSADWAAQRIKGLNFTSAVKAAIIPQRVRSDGHQGVIKTLIDAFRYPRLGPGQMWERARDRILETGQAVKMGERIVRVRHAAGRVIAITTVNKRGGTQEYTGDDFISSIPIRELIAAFDPAPPASVIAAAQALRYRDYLTVALILRRQDVFPDNWIYIHDPSVQMGRIQNYKNWSPAMVPDPTTTCLGLEYFCFEGDGLWTSDNQDLIALGTRELASIGLGQPHEVIDGTVVRMPKAYPVYDDSYKLHLATIRAYLEVAATNLHLAGRNGMHKYNNQDHSMMTALLDARNIIAGRQVYDVWRVNTDAEYHEQAGIDELAEDRAVPLIPSHA